MAVSNPLFFDVYEVPPLADAGWEVRVKNYKDFSTLETIVYQYVSLSFDIAINDVGGGSITLDLDQDDFWYSFLQNGRRAFHLKDRSYLWEIYHDGVLRAQFIGERVQEHPISEDGDRLVTISGPGPAHTLTWQKVLPAGFPNYSAVAPVYNFNNKRIMDVWLRLFNTAKNRGTARYVTPTFTGARDSAGVIWEDTNLPQLEIEIPFGEDMLSLLQMATGQDNNDPRTILVDWYMHPGFKLDVRREIGSYRHNQVIFHEPLIISKTRIRERDEISNFIVTRNDLGVTSYSLDSGSISEWQRREHLEMMDVYTPTGLLRSAQNMIAQNKDELSSWTIGVPFSLPGREVFKDYSLGDWISIENRNEQGVFTNDRYKIMAITVAVDPNGQTTLELTLESLLQNFRRKLQRQLFKIKAETSKPPVPNITTPAIPKKGPVVYDPGTTNLYPGDEGYVAPGYTVADDDDYFGGGGIGGGTQVYIQSTEPSAANVGDFWLDTSIEVE